MPSLPVTRRLGSISQRIHERQNPSELGPGSGAPKQGASTAAAVVRNLAVTQLAPSRNGLIRKPSHLCTHRNFKLRAQ